MVVEPSQRGPRKCMSCGKTFKSTDVMRIRRCPKCKKREDGYSPNMVRMIDVRGAIRNHFEGH